MRVTPSYLEDVAVKLETLLTVVFPRDRRRARVNGERVDEKYEERFFQDLDEQDRHVPVTSSFQASYPLNSSFVVMGHMSTNCRLERCC